MKEANVLKKKQVTPEVTDTPDVSQASLFETAVDSVTSTKNVEPKFSVKVEDLAPEAPIVPPRPARSVPLEQAKQPPIMNPIITIGHPEPIRVVSRISERTLAEMEAGRRLVDRYK